MSPGALGLTALAAALAPLVGVVQYVTSGDHARHDPAHALQQLDLLYLDQPAPLAEELGLRRGEVSLVVVCPRPGCPLPELDGATVVPSSDPRVARAYALDGRTGYALVDPALQVRYRSVDPRVHEHERELRVLVDAVARP